MKRLTSFVVLVMLASLNIASASTPSNLKEVEKWLQKVVDATKTLNYEGVFVYQHDNHIETMRIIHKVDGSNRHERLVSLNGEAREVIRKNEKVFCISPNDKSVLEDNALPKTNLPVVPHSLPLLKDSYHFTVGEDGRIAGREVKQIIIKPHDIFRYGYRLWIDKEAGLLLRSELVNNKGKTVEQLLFTDVVIRNHIPDEMLTPSLEGHKLTWIKSEDKPTHRLGDMNKWEVTDLPKGYIMAHYNTHSMPADRKPVDHMVYTDGLAWVSIYIEDSKKDATQHAGLSRMGSVNAFGKRVDDYFVTVVGEVPEFAVRKIGNSVRFKRRIHQ